MSTTSQNPDLRSWWSFRPLPYTNRGFLSHTLIWVSLSVRGSLWEFILTGIFSFFSHILTDFLFFDEFPNSYSVFSEGGVLFDEFQTHITLRLFLMYLVLHLMFASQNYPFFWASNHARKNLFLLSWQLLLYDLLFIAQPMEFLQLPWVRERISGHYLFHAIF